jgi:hypothetical protein
MAMAVLLGLVTTECEDTMPLRGIDVIGQGMLRGIPGLMESLAKRYQEQQRQQEIQSLLGGLRPGGEPTSFGPQGGTLQNPNGTLNQMQPTSYSPSRELMDNANIPAIMRLRELGYDVTPFQSKKQFIQGDRGQLGFGEIPPSGSPSYTQINARAPEVVRPPVGQSPSNDWQGEFVVPGVPLLKKLSGTNKTYQPEFKWADPTDHSKGKIYKGVEGTEPAGIGDPPKRRTDLVRRFNSDPNVRKAVSSENSAAELDQLADSNNPISNNAIATIAARASGEVGNLSEADKAPFGGSQAIVARLAQFASTNVTGLRTPENKKWIKGLAQVFRDHGKRMKVNIADEWSKQYSQTDTSLGSSDDIFRVLSPDGTRPGSTSSPSIGPEIMVGRGGKKYQFKGGDRKDKNNWEEVK